MSPRLSEVMYLTLESLNAATLPLCSAFCSRSMRSTRMNEVRCRHSLQTLRRPPLLLARRAAVMMAALTDAYSP